jgi:phosphate transport system ATP-binding protein
LPCFSFTYDGANKPSLKNINLPIFYKKITALIGYSGCGKSTLLRSLNRIHDLYGGKYEGEILLKNIKTKKMENILEFKESKLIHLRQRVGMIFQKPIPFPFSIFENISYGLKLKGIKSKSELEGRVEDALKKAALWNEVKDRLKEDANSLSGGQQQRLCIARAIALNPEVLLMDEPTSALDIVSTKAIEELIIKLKENTTIILVTHNMHQASSISDYTAFMHFGELIEFNKTSQFFLNPQKKLTANYLEKFITTDNKKALD